MQTDIAAERGRVVELARQWMNTPYRHMQRVKGHGADCAMMPLEVYSEEGLIRRLTVEGDPGVTDPDIPYYPQDWHLHRDAERYLPIVEQLITEAGGGEVEPPQIRKPEPGDFILVKFARAYSHGAIVIDWPICIHAHLHRGVVLVDAVRDPKIGEKIRLGLVKVFSLWNDDVSEGSVVSDSALALGAVDLAAVAPRSPWEDD
jgi:cell wall-associated NlpC family hydrolase